MNYVVSIVSQNTSLVELHVPPPLTLRLNLKLETNAESRNDAASPDSLDPDYEFINKRKEHVKQVVLKSVVTS